jgi:hypothetical protein
MLGLAGITLQGDYIMRSFFWGPPGKPGRAARRAMLAGLAAVASMGVAVPVQAETGDAEKLLRLDIMLMVTGLRCRAGGDDFWSDYGRFTAKHMGILNGANNDLRADFDRRLGESAGKLALDRMSVTIANQFGIGHPWLDCGQLKIVANNLAEADGRATLVEAAGQLLSPRRIENYALARR